MLSSGVLVSVAVLVVVLGTDLWVLSDARKRARLGAPVSVSIGNFEVSTPEGWFLGCVVLWVVFLPLYLTATGRNPFVPAR
jgi:hypothetical protein